MGEEKKYFDDGMNSTSPSGSSPKKNVKVFNLGEYEKEFRIGVGLLLDGGKGGCLVRDDGACMLIDGGSELGKWFNECCCQYAGPYHGDWVEMLTNWMIDEVRKIERSGGV